ncbi:MAG: argininosuccinate lyase [Candidatus Obscuribacter sp.]|nr:argininosuccinate lyase [Candidatus Obscuribacter sp.]MBP6347924.1 argininosuccinate lyase [Candidatus Obscuribacter sp.]MBP6591377.1 argininosuccinate lyase [Candidatus Obscuribacter sp.]MBP7576228.1 argininosuccinate lyase [Candidatus Obscuribacter sp.]
MQVLRKAFTQQLDQSVTAFVNSVDADEALIAVDIKGSITHATMLCQQGLLTEAQAANIVSGLNAILVEHQEGKFKLNPVFEDVHMNVEKRLEQLIGQDALRLHTARSRNDQVALDLRLFVLEQITQHQAQIQTLKSAVAQCALSNIDAVMPGYTHLQRAQPVHFAHAMHAFMEMLERDYSRFSDLAKRTAVSPLGAGAQAGTGLPIDPHLSAKLLGMPTCFNNSIDAVSDRDFVAEYLFTSSMCAVHLSQMAETFVIWATREFGFITFSDAVTTASSLMPQKKNPDPVEIVRGKAGAMMGELINVLATLKGLPLGYNRDLQETKPPAIKVSKELSGCLNVMAVAVQSMTVNSAVTLAAASDPDMITTDLVEYLVNKSVPFRKAHEEVSALVAYAREKSVPLSTLSLTEMQSFSGGYDADVMALFDPVVSVKAKTSHGSTGTAKVEAVVKSANS